MWERDEQEGGKGGEERDEREGENERGRKRKEGEKRGEGEREKGRKWGGERERRLFMTYCPPRDHSTIWVASVPGSLLKKNGERAWDWGYYMGVLACTSSSYTSNSRPPHTAFVACMQVTKAMWGLIHLFLAFLVQVSSAPGVLRWESLWAAGRTAGEEVWVWEDADGTWGDREGPQTLSTGAGETEEEGR